jgi:pyrimidine-nucleoside phosphorylase
MMSGRGLAHTGGTLDKLEAIPGFRVHLTLDEFRAALKRVGCAIVGPTPEIAPADKVLYALRDVTATVESLPLICASIMSKKIAEGIDGLVLDVKCGTGAFMKTRAEARRLTESLMAVGAGNGVRTEAVLTAKDAPHGRAVGNALEVAEAVDTLKGRGPADVEALSVLLTARMVRLAGLATTLAEAEGRVRSALSSGAGLEKLRAVIEQQGGDPHVIDEQRRLPAAPRQTPLHAERSGYLHGFEAGRVGRAALLLGAGRDRAEQAVDPAAGVVLLAAPGERVQAGDTLALLHHRDGARLADALALLREACAVRDEPPSETPLILETLAATT